MKRTIPLFVCAAFAALLVAECAFAETVVVSALQGQPVKRDSRDYTSTVLGWSDTPSLWAENTVQAESRLRSRSGGVDAWKSWLQFDVSDVWATHDKADLAGATLSVIVEAGTKTRMRFYVYGMTDGLQIGGSSAENWDENTLTWNNAPANDYADTTGSLLVTDQVYNGAAFESPTYASVLTGNYYWSVGETAPGVYNQAVLDAVKAFVLTDTDGKITFIMTGYDTAYFKGVGDVLGSPTLELTFIPEPATLAILGLGGLLLRRRIA